MGLNKPFHKEKLSFLRKAVIASASITKQKNTIHSFTELDVSIPKRLINDYKEKHGVKLSFTGYIVSCLATVLKKHPRLNSFISGNNMVYLEGITISVLIERQMGDASVPEPLPIENCDSKNCLDITNTIRNAQKSNENYLGGLSGNSWFRFIPGFLLKAFVRIADKNIKMGIKYGKVAVTSVGMFTKDPAWFVPHGSATVLVTVGSIINRIVEIDGKYENRERLCLTVSFDHDIVDGAPAARFMGDFMEEVKSGRQVSALL